MKEKVPSTDSDTGAPGSKGLTRREVLRKMGKAVYVAPVLMVLKRPPRNRPQDHLGSPPDPP